MSSQELGLYVPLIIYTVTLAIELVSVFLVYRQRATAYPSVRTSLLSVYVISILILLLEYVRLFLQSPTNPVSVSYMKIYAATGLSLLFLVVILLTLAALAIYLRPKQGGNFGDLFKDILNNKREGIIFFAYVALVLGTAVYIDLFEPYTITPVHDLFKNQIYAVTYAPAAFALLAAILVFFLVYPVPLFFLTARKITNDQVKRNLMILPLCWIGIGVDLLLVEGYLSSLKISASPIVYLVWGGLFSITAVVFSNASTVSSFFDVSVRSSSTTATQVGASAKPFSERLGRNQDLALLGNSILLEVDPSIKYEDAIKDFAAELMSNSYVVFVFTSRFSPIFSALSGLKEVRFYLLSANVSYVKPTPNPYHMMIPQSDFAVILDAIQTTVERTQEQAPIAKVGFIFDNLSDMITNSDFDSSYKFLKRQNEAVNDPNVTKLFLLIKGAQDVKQVNLIKSVFPIQLGIDSTGLKREK